MFIESVNVYDQHLSAPKLNCAATRPQYFRSLKSLSQTLLFRPVRFLRVRFESLLLSVLATRLLRANFKAMSTEGNNELLLLITACLHEVLLKYWKRVGRFAWWRENLKMCETACLSAPPPQIGTMACCQALVHHSGSLPTRYRPAELQRRALASRLQLMMIERRAAMAFVGW